MENIYVIEIAIDAKEKKLATRVGCNKEDFDEEVFKIIENATQELSQMVGMAYMSKLERKKEDA